MVAVPDEQGMPALVALASGGFEVSFDLGLEGLGEHLLGSLASDLVQIEQGGLLAWRLLVVYAVHRCTLSKPTVVRRLFRSIARREGTPGLSGNLRSTAFYNTSSSTLPQHSHKRLRASNGGGCSSTCRLSENSKYK